MRKLPAFLIVIALATTGLKAQKIEKFFDYQWKPSDVENARFVAVIKNTDSGWLRKDYYIREQHIQMSGLYTDSACKNANGTFYYFHANRSLKSLGKYVNNKKEGLWLSYYDNGGMEDSTFYEEGHPTGISRSWYDDGSAMDSITYNADGSGVSVTWFDNGNLSSAGRLNPLQQMHGKWQFFHRNGQLSASEIYNNGALVDKKYFSENGTPMDTTSHQNNPSFPGGMEKWTRYLENNLYWPVGYKIVNGDKATVVIGFSVAENGEIKNPHVQNSFHETFDRIALQAIKSSPKWTPASDHNRKVRFNWRQSITFSQTQ